MSPDYFNARRSVSSLKKQPCAIYVLTEVCVFHNNDGSKVTTTYGETSFACSEPIKENSLVV